MSFAPIENGGGGARAHLEARWEACDRLGMRAPVPDAGVPAELVWPDRVLESEPRAIAAVQRDGGGDGVYQAYAFTFHDVVGVAAALAPNVAEADLDAWDQLHREWTGAAGAAELPDRVLGEALVFSAMLPAPDAESTGAAVAASLPGDGPAPEPVPSLWTDRGVLHWEREGDARRRHLAVVAPAAREAELDAWLWWDRARRAPARGLLALVVQVLKLRYEQRSYLASSGALREAERLVDAELSELLVVLRDLHRRRPDRFAIEELLAVQDRLLQHQAGTGGLLMMTSRLKELRRTVVIAQANLADLMPPARAGTTPRLFERDIADGHRLVERIDDDLVYAEALQERSREAQRLAALRVQQAGQHQAREHTRLTLLQTTLIGSLLAAAGAIGTLDPDIDVAGRLRLPGVALIASAVLALPHLIVNWPERYRTLDYVVAALFGVALLWFVSRIVDAGTAGQIALAAGGGALAPVLAYSGERMLAARNRPWLRGSPR